MRLRTLVAVTIGVGLLAAVSACGDDDGGSSTATTTAGGGGGKCIVGVSWNNYQEERWAKFDEPAIKDAVEAGGGTYVSNDAKSSAETQASNVENLISQGANVLIILAQDGTAIKPSVASAVSARRAGHRVRPPHRGSRPLSTSPSTTSRSGDCEAQEVFKAVPKGNYIIIKGNKADANADFLRSGYDEVIKDAVESGDIKIVGETYTDNWDPSKAQTETEQFLTAANNDVQAVLSENDGMAGGVVAALEAQGLAGKVPVSGQDGDQAALNRVALGTQTVSVWKDARLLGKTAGEAAIAAVQGQGRQQGEGHRPVHDPGWQRRHVDPAQAAADHQGQPRRRHRRRLDDQGQRVQGRDGRFGTGLLIGSTSVERGR